MQIFQHQQHESGARHSLQVFDQILYRPVSQLLRIVLNRLQMWVIF